MKHYPPTSRNVLSSLKSPFQTFWLLPNSLAIVSSALQKPSLFSSHFSKENICLEEPSHVFCREITSARKTIAKPHEQFLLSLSLVRSRQADFGTEQKYKGITPSESELLKSQQKGKDTKNIENKTIPTSFLSFLSKRSY